MEGPLSYEECKKALDTFQNNKAPGEDGFTVEFHTFFRKKIEPLLPNLVHSDQTGFIKRRYIGENTRLIIDIMEHTKSESIPGILVSLDFRKAFDSLEWSFMMKALDIFNFRTSIK